MNKNLKDIIISNINNFDVELLLKKDIQNKIEQNEINNINFYQIDQLEGGNKDSMKKGTKQIGNYKSKRYLSDMVLLKGTKLYKKPDYNYYE